MKKTEYDDKLKSLTLKFLKNTKEHLKEIHRFAKINDYISIFEIAHRIKGKGGLFGFNEITDIGRQMEKAAAGKDSLLLKNSCFRLEKFLDRAES